MLRQVLGCKRCEQLLVSCKVRNVNNSVACWPCYTAKTKCSMTELLYNAGMGGRRGNRAVSRGRSNKPKNSDTAPSSSSAGQDSKQPRRSSVGPKKSSMKPPSTSSCRSGSTPAENRVAGAPKYNEHCKSIVY